jgi:multiple antibiotic resistance protein
MDLLSATLLLIIVTDPLGNIPMVLACLEGVKRRRRFIIREVALATIVLVVFLFFGPWLLLLLGLSQEALRLSGGLILFLIAIKMMFPSSPNWMGLKQGEEPILFPLAVPLVAGPSAVATVILFSAQYPDKMGVWLVAIILCMAVSLVIFLGSSVLHRIMGHRGLAAMERLMGMILAAISVQMMLTGMREVFGVAA